jgi:hypothetical protein
MKIDKKTIVYWWVMMSEGGKVVSVHQTPCERFVDKRRKNPDKQKNSGILCARKAPLCLCAFLLQMR